MLGPETLARYRALGIAQPLILIREPNNPKDEAAVLLKDLMLAPVGYVAREDAPTVCAKLLAGEVVLCRTNGDDEGGMRPIYIWSEGQTIKRVVEKRALVGAHEDDDQWPGD